MVLICISPVTNGIDRIFMCLLACNIFFGKVTRKPLCLFINWLVCFLVIELQKFFLFLIEGFFNQNCNWRKFPASP